jgi:3-hydroxyisobutyrate dehydrogenase
MGRVTRGGETGAGAATKLVINSLGAHLMAGFAASLTLAVKLGLDPQTTLDAILAGGFSSPVFQHRGPKILAGDFTPPDFTLRLALKDQRLALDAAARVGLEMPTLEAVVAVIREAIAQGHGEEDLGAIIRVFESQAGVEVRKK